MDLETLTGLLAQDNKTDAVAPSAETSLAYFLGKLSCECDPSDVENDLRVNPRMVLVDARSPESYAKEHIPGSVNLHHGSFTAEDLQGLDTSRTYVTYGFGPDCNAGTKGAARLAAAGFSVKEMIGGLEYWKRDGFPVESGL